MLPSTTNYIVLNQGLVESQEALVTSHMMNFFPQPHDLILPNPLETLTSSFRVNEQFASNLREFGSSSSSSIQESNSINPWLWCEEGSLRTVPQQAKEDLYNSNKNNRNYNNNTNSLSSIGAKRLKKVMKAKRKVREPRFCFKTMSEVDVLDDGYKWRKYGQKVVKNTQHPRSYYRCTQDNCIVKKRVERLAEDARMVITTYEGRHAHSPPQDEDESNQASSHINFFC